MAQFMYGGLNFEGINPAGITFQRQTDKNGCWAACLANARSALLGMSDVSDQHIIAVTHPGFKSSAIYENQMLESILVVSEKTGVTPGTKELWKFADPGAIDGVDNAIRHEYPCIFDFQFPDEKVGHQFLALAVGGQVGNTYLVYDPYPGIEGSGTTATINQAKEGGLRTLTYGDIQKYGNYAIPLKKRVMG